MPKKNIITFIYLVSISITGYLIDFDKLFKITTDLHNYRLGKSNI